MFLKSEEIEGRRGINGFLSFQVSSVFLTPGEDSLIRPYNRVSCVLPIPISLTPFHDLPNFTVKFGWGQALSHSTICCDFSTVNPFGG